MSKVTTECNGCVPAEKGHDRPATAHGRHSCAEGADVDPLVNSPVNAAAKQEALELLEKLRAANKQIVLQSQRIEELESYLHCIVSLSAKVRELELDTSL